MRGRIRPVEIENIEENVVGEHVKCQASRALSSIWASACVEGTAQITYFDLVAGSFGDLKDPQGDYMQYKFFRAT